MAAEYGFVYVLGNESMPGIFKIGFTAMHPKTRMDQLSSSTSCPTLFDLLACFGVEYAHDVEQEIHKTLEGYRINPQREFFKAPVAVIKEAMGKYMDEYEDLVQINRLNSLCFLDDFEKYHVEQEYKKSYFLEQCVDPIYWPQKRVGFS